MRLWDLTAHPQVGSRLTGHTHPVAALAFSPDGKTVATGSLDSVRLWDVATRRQVGSEFTGLTGVVASLVFSSDGKKLLAASLDNSVRLWDVASHQLLDSWRTDRSDFPTR